jgi:hypothetical protein
VKIGSVVMMVFACAVPAFEAFITPFWWGLLLWLIGGPMLKGACRYLKAVEVVGLANMVTVLAAALKILLILVTGNLFAGASPALLIPNFDPGVPWHSALLNLDLLTFWVLAVRGLGIARVSGVAAGKAIGWTFAFWAIMTGFLATLGWVVQRLFGG